MTTETYWQIQDLTQQADDWLDAALNPLLSWKFRHEAAEVYEWMNEKIEKLKTGD